MGTLTDVQLRNWVRAGAPIAKSDGDGLTFTLSSTGAASWVLRFRIHGKQRELTLGRYPEISAATARRLAMEMRTQVQQGVDVARDKQKTKLELERSWTFQRLADDYMTKAAGYLAEATLAGRKQQLRDYVFNRIGKLPATEVSPRDIVDIVERSAEKSLHVARLVLIAIRAVFAHGIARHVVSSDPSVHIKAKAIIGARPSSRERIMLTDAELVELLAELPQIGRENELATKLLLATCTRIGEFVNAEWKHIDFECKEWTIPPEHSKNKKQFVIPITDYVAHLFMELHRLAFHSRFILPIRLRHNGREGDAPMEATSLNAALDRLHEKLGKRCRRITPHDLRSTARSHLGALSIDVLIAERCLNHSLGGLVAVYDKHDYLVERRKALDLWNTKIAALEKGPAFNVVPLRLAAGI